MQILEMSSVRVTTETVSKANTKPAYLPIIRNRVVDGIDKEVVELDAKGCMNVGRRVGGEAEVKVN